MLKKEWPFLPYPLLMMAILAVALMTTKEGVMEAAYFLSVQGWIIAVFITDELKKKG